MLGPGPCLLSSVQHCWACSRGRGYSWIWRQCNRTSNSCDRPCSISNSCNSSCSFFEHGCRPCCHCNPSDEPWSCSSFCDRLSSCSKLLQWALQLLWLFEGIRLGCCFLRHVVKLPCNETQSGLLVKWLLWLNPVGGWAPHSHLLTLPFPVKEVKKENKAVLVGWDKTMY